MARDMPFCEIPIGLRYSSKRISPGVIGSYMTIPYDVIGVLSMIINDGDPFRS